jgi:exosortase A-associated hydrolase 2
VQEIRAFFLPREEGGRFSLLHSPAGGASCRGAIVYVHPFAEEMNKSRRMAALQARTLAAAGFAVLQIDLFGCGDSAGEFGHATWDAWVDDVISACDWLREHTGIVPALWGLRAGCLIARDAAQRLTPTPDLVLWQPVISGSQHLLQFLRLRVANRIIGNDADARVGTKELRAELAHGATIEVAGYPLAPKLAQGLETAEMTALRGAGRVAWLEVSASEPAELSPAGRLRMQAWQSAGHDVADYAVAGLPFWQTTEIAECPALLEATRDAVLRWHR